MTSTETPAHSPDPAPGPARPVAGISDAARQEAERRTVGRPTQDAPANDAACRAA